MHSGNADVRTAAHARRLAITCLTAVRAHVARESGDSLSLWWNQSPCAMTQYVDDVILVDAGDKVLTGLQQLMLLRQTPTH